MSQKRRRRRIVAGVALLASLGIALGILLAVLVDGADRQVPVRNPAHSSTVAVKTGGGTATRAQAPTMQAAPTAEAIEANARYTGGMEALSAVLVDEDGTVLYSKHADDKRYPASMTKVLTALLVLENGRLEDEVRVGAEADIPASDSSNAKLRYGEKLTVMQLLNALLIPSGNDAAYVLAVYAARKAAGDAGMDIAAAVEKFVGMMNARARELGAESSHFVNPDGYHDDAHYTTAMDMAVIAGKAMENQTFRQIVATKEYRLPDVPGKDDNGHPQQVKRLFYNTNKLLQKDNSWDIDSCTGIKTGHTSDAGHCLVSSASRQGGEIIAVVMGSTDAAVWRDSAALLEWGASLK